MEILIFFANNTESPFSTLFNFRRVQCAHTAVIALEIKEKENLLKTNDNNTARNAKNTDPKFFSKRLKSIYGIPYLKAKNSVLCPC